MHDHASDRDIARLVWGSVVFRLVRSFFESLGRAAAGSRILRPFARPPTLPALAIAIAIASLTHAVLVSLVPLSLAPLGRYLFAAAGLALAAALLAAGRLHHR